MKRLLFLVLVVTPFTTCLADHTATSDSVPAQKRPNRQSPYQPPPPIIMPGTHLDTNFRTIARQDPAVRRVAPGWLRDRTKGEPTYILDGNVATVKQIRRLKQSDVASITSMDGEKAAALYGPNAKQGLLIITTKASL